jgi:hypothetical protein
VVFLGLRLQQKSVTIIKKVDQEKEDQDHVHMKDAAVLVN